MKFILPFLIAILINGPQTALAQSDCDGTRYRFASAFESFEVTSDIVYGNSINSTGFGQNLLSTFTSHREMSMKIVR